MDEETTKTYLKRLMSEKAKLEQRIDTLEGKGEGGTMQSMKDSIGELSSYDNHPADVSSELFERGKDIKLCEDAKILLKRVDEAIELLNSGKYGICEHCSGSIEEERLELIPYTRLCSRCQSHMDIAQPPRKDRPIEEEVLGIPFGGARATGRLPVLTERTYGKSWRDTGQQAALKTWQVHLTMRRYMRRVEVMSGNL